MYINLDPGSVGIDLPLDELIPLASRHGYAGINLPLEQAAALPDPDALTAEMQEANLRFGGFARRGHLCVCPQNPGLRRTRHPGALLGSPERAARR